MRVRVLAILITGILSGAILAQDQPPAPLPIPPPPPPADAATAPSAPGAAQPETETDRFPALREAADMLRAKYEELDAKNMADIKRLSHSSRCQINRIGPLLDRTKVAMEEWAAAETKYWQVWGEAEQKRVEKGEKDLANMEAELKHAGDLQDSEKQDELELQKQKNLLEQSKRTEEVNNKIDSLIKEIQDTEARLAEAQQQYETLTAQVTTMKTYLYARLVEIRHNKAKVEAEAIDLRAVYEKERAAANEVCNTKKPDERATPPSKKPAGG